MNRPKLCHYFLKESLLTIKIKVGKRELKITIHTNNICRVVK